MTGILRTQSRKQPRNKRKDGKQKGILKKIERRDQKIGNWERFILLEDNKAVLADSLSTEISQRYTTPREKELVLSGGFSKAKKFWSSNMLRNDELDPLFSDHEEADTRILLQTRDAARKGFKQVNVLCVTPTSLCCCFFIGSNYVMRSGCSQEVEREGDIVQSIEFACQKRSRSYCWHSMP